MICQFVCEAVVKHEVLSDGKVVKVEFLSGEDQVKLVVPTPELDNLIQKLTDARDEAKALGVEQADAFQFRIAKSVAVGAVEKQPGAVAITFDRSLPGRMGFMVTSTAARACGHRFIEAAREAESLVTRAQLRTGRPKLG